MGLTQLNPLLPSQNFVAAPLTGTFYNSLKPVGDPISSLQRLMFGCLHHSCWAIHCVFIVIYEHPLKDRLFWQRLAEFFGVYETIPYNPNHGRIAKLLCSKHSPTAPICALLYFMYAGWDPKQLDKVCTECGCGYVYGLHCFRSTPVFFVFYNMDKAIERLSGK